VWPRKSKQERNSRKSAEIKLSAGGYCRQSIEISKKSVVAVENRCCEMVFLQTLNGLTQREREVLACLAVGDNNRAIAQQLGIGEGTVRSHVHVLLQKLQVSNRTQAALIWLATAAKQ
jgi:DNA-binding NarL/FixJ family response regulator